MESSLIDLLLDIRLWIYKYFRVQFTWRPPYMFCLFGISVFLGCLVGLLSLAVGVVRVVASKMASDLKI